MENRKKAYAVNKKNDVDGLFVDKTEEMRVKFSQPIEEDGDEGSEASDENKEKEKKGEEERESEGRRKISCATGDIHM